ncbi:MAG: hypothetical protein ACREE0_23350 [Phenylobacterium sp.]
MILALLLSATFALDQGAPGGGATPAAAPAPPAKTTAAAPTKSAKADSERVCKLEATLGSKITKKVCYNRALMEDRTFYDKQNLELIQNATPAMNR